MNAHDWDTARRSFGRSFEMMDTMAWDKNIAAKLGGTIVAVGMPPLVVKAAVLGSGLTGGAAIMKGLAVLGAFFGGVAIVGVAVVGLVSIVAGYCAYKTIKYVTGPGSDLGGRIVSRVA